MNYLFALVLLPLPVSILGKKCCQFPAYSFSAMTNVTKEDFKCSEPVSVLCQIDTNGSGYVAVGISGNLTEQADTKPLVIKKGSSSISASLVCDTSSQMWKVDKKSDKYDNIGCIMRSTGGVWIVY
ncbi:C6 domain-containing protein [Caenorhabditis elegans]|uniref:C6 domain-containing protein n=1 Tax=Caenorhabditis elegans TaxID=6239 RepID=Q2V4S7_CAEEL|nr:C6 domain-containing protein [Caenorhabditis elegans]CCD70471.1 C6 domain-containing protein [Caenorhabditis elegans]|eukprot:NP_001040785.2 Uncharacterized protein CELE_F59A6.12 [Caenorhabditis elegans]